MAEHDTTPPPPRAGETFTMASPFPPGTLQKQLKPKPSGWGVLLSKRGLMALGLILGLAGDALGTAYPQVTGIIGGASKLLELLQ